MITEYKILVVGIHRIWAGITNPAAILLERYNVITHFLYRQTVKEFTQRIPKGVRVTYLTTNPIRNAWIVWKTIQKEKPAHIEYYHHLSPRWAIWEFIPIVLSRVPIIVVCTGGEIREWESHKPQRRLLIRASSLVAKKIIVKELYMRDYISTYSIGNVSKAVVIHNHIITRELHSVKREKPVVLFLNMFQPMRNVDLIVKAAPYVIEAIPEVEFRLVGLLGRWNEEELKTMVKDMNLKANVKLLPFTTEQVKEYENASVFILPADSVFCNNALLEAMERGVPPVVADVPGAEKIVEHNVSGLRVKKDPKEIADALITLLSDERARENLAWGARKKIEQEFAESRRAEKLIQLYKEMMS